MSINIKGSTVKENDIKAYGIYTIGAVIFLLLTIFTGMKLANTFAKIFTDTSDLNTDIVLLNGKIDSLKTINQNVDIDVDSLVVSFPAEDPILFAYSQLKSIAMESQVFVDNIQFSKQTEIANTVSASKLSFTVIGGKKEFEDFLHALTNSAPLSGLGEMNITYVEGGNGIVDVGMSLDFYFSPLPIQLSSSENAVNVLSASEQETYKKLSDLKVYNNYRVNASLPTNGDTNPFTSAVSETTENEESTE